MTHLSVPIELVERILKSSRTLMHASDLANFQVSSKKVRKFKAKLCGSGRAFDQFLEQEQALIKKKGIEALKELVYLCGCIVSGSLRETYYRPFENKVFAFFGASLSREQNLCYRLIYKVLWHPLRRNFFQLDDDVPALIKKAETSIFKDDWFHVGLQPSTIQKLLDLRKRAESWLKRIPKTMSN